MNCVRKAYDRCHIFEKFPKRAIVSQPEMLWYLYRRFGKGAGGSAMNRLVDIVILLLLGMGFQLRESGEMIPVLAMLVGLILAALSFYLSNDRKFAILAVAGFAAVFF